MREKLSGLQLNRTKRKIMNSCYLKSEYERLYYMDNIQNETFYNKNS